MSVTLPDKLAEVKNRLHGDEALLWLLDLDRNGTDHLRLVDWPDSVTYNSQTFTRAPIKVDEIPETAGQMAQFNVTLPNILGEFSTRLGDGELLNRDAILYLLPESRIGFTTGALSATYKVLTASVDDKAATLLLGSFGSARITVPTVRFNRTRCRWVFKSTQCGYVGAETTCNKSFAGAGGCRGRANQARYGGFPNLHDGPEPFGGAGV